MAKISELPFVLSPDGLEYVLILKDGVAQIARLDTIPQGGPGGGPFRFTNLLDAPDTLEGQGGKAVVVSADGTGLELVPLPEPGDASAETFTTLAAPPPAPDTGWSQISREFDSPSRPTGNPITIKWREVFTYSPYNANGIIPGSPKLTNRVWGGGWNITNAFTPLDTNEGAPNYRIESKFAKSSRNPAKAFITGAEQHHAMHTKGAGGSEYRSISLWQPDDAADWGYDSDASFQAAVYAFADGYRNVHVSFDWSGTESSARGVSLSNKVRLNFLSNNQAIVTQANAAGNAQLPLPHINDGNYLQVGQPIYMTCDLPGPNALGIQSLLTMVGTAGFTSGARLAYMNTNGITGFATGYEIEQSASNYLAGLRVRNTHPTGASVIKLHGNAATSIDFFNETSYLNWGMRLKPNGDFCIGQQENGVAWGAGDAIRINYTTMQVSFVKAPRLPNATVAGAGSASAAGIGAQHYVTDLNSIAPGTIAAGGGEYDGVVVSDGSAWRIVAAW